MATCTGLVVRLMCLSPNHAHSQCQLLIGRSRVMRQLVHWVTLTPNPQRHAMPCEHRGLQAEGLQGMHYSFPLLLVVPGTALC